MEEEMKRFHLVALVFLLISPVLVQATDEPVVIGDVTMPTVESSAAFKQVEKKLGKWEGKMTQGLTGADIDITYE